MQATTQPAFFKQGPTPLNQFLVYASLSLALLVVDHRYHMLVPAREIVSVALYPLQRLATAPVSAARRVSEFLVAQSALLQENRRLQDERLIANAQTLRVATLQADNEQLKALLNARDSRQGHGILTEVLYNGLDPFVAKLIVDRGELASVRPGQVVIDPKGVVGQITRVQPLTGEVTLVTEKNHAVPVQVQRNGLRAIVYGMGPENPLEIRFMPANADLKEGDLLVTSGIDGTYPVGLPVATVKRVDRNSGLAFAKISCTPAADVANNRFFLILDEQRALPPRPPEAAVIEAKPKKKRGRGGDD